MNERHPVKGWVIMSFVDGDAWILDSSENLKSEGFFPEGPLAIDNNFHIPRDLNPKCVYRVSNLQYVGGEQGRSGDWESPEMSGDWTPMLVWNGEGLPK